jgi:hypothetical protein
VVHGKPFLILGGELGNSSAGTAAQVAQKSGLNRAILDGSPFELRRQQQYKTDLNLGMR